MTRGIFEVYLFIILKYNFKIPLQLIKTISKNKTSYVAENSKHYMYDKYFLL